MRTFLQAEGYEVEGFDSAQEANLTIGAGGADMVIMGLTFADIDGIDFVKKTVESFSGPVIVLSASLDKAKERELKEMGILKALNKSGPWKDEIKPYLSKAKKA